MTRRGFLVVCGAALAGGAAVLSRVLQAGPNNEARPAEGRQAEARFYRRADGRTVECDLCFRGCRIADGTNGFCRNRVNRAGVLYSTVYGRPSAVNVEPVEKEPMHHFLPGTNMLCIGTASCNYRCRFCHNWHLSQRSLEEVRYALDIQPRAMVDRARSAAVPAVSFTYNEPTVFYEYVYDIAAKAQDAGVRTIMHTNGGMSPRPLRALLEHMDGVTVDLKAWSREFYADVCGARRDPVLETLRIIREKGAWLEIVNLVLPDHNDGPEEIRSMCRWIRRELGEATPLHFSRFHPTYRMADLAPTPVATLERCREIALAEGLHYVSIGNVPGHPANSTYCPGCAEQIIVRHHFTVTRIAMDDGRCAYCGHAIPGVWS